jgi:hypothetical protein
MSAMTASAKSAGSATLRSLVRGMGLLGPYFRLLEIRREEAGVSVTEWTMEGSNLVAAFQGIDSITSAAAPWFELARDIPRNETKFDQAIAVLRRR